MNLEIYWIHCIELEGPDIPTVNNFHEFSFIEIPINSVIECIYYLISIHQVYVHSTFFYILVGADINCVCTMHDHNDPVYGAVVGGRGKLKKNREQIQRYVWGIRF